MKLLSVNLRFFTKEFRDEMISKWISLERNTLRQNVDHLRR